MFSSIDALVKNMVLDIFQKKTKLLTSLYSQPLEDYKDLFSPETKPSTRSEKLGNKAATRIFS